MIPYCLDLNIDKPLFADKETLLQLWQGTQIKVEEKILHPDLLRMFKNIGLEYRFGETFQREENYYSPLVHSDAPDLDQPDAAKINWVFGGSGSLMHWYEPVNEKFGFTSKTVLGSKFKLYDKADVRLVHSQKIGCPSIVQVGMLHDVTTGPEKRLCVSILLQPIGEDRYMSFDELMSYLKDFITEA